VPGSGVGTAAVWNSDNRGDLGKGFRERRSCFDRSDPGADLMREWGDEEAAEDGRTLLEAVKGAAEKRACPDGVAAVQMVEGGCHLNEGLKKTLLGLVEFEPRAFPVLVCFEELPVAVAGETFGEIGRGPVERAHSG
jgi:hypothetical protein